MATLLVVEDNEETWDMISRRPALLAERLFAVARKLISGLDQPAPATLLDRCHALPLLVG
jgi:hypothetical protein